VIKNNQMINSKKDYYYCLEADRIALGFIHRKRPRLFITAGQEVWIFLRLLRKCEYWTNCLINKSIFYKMIFLLLKTILIKKAIKLNIIIPLNVFGPGLSIAHYGPIVVNSGAKVGENCRIHHCVTIGTEAGYAGKAPKIGNNCFIGPGVQMFGDIVIADNIAIGANSVVNRSFLETNITIAGVPAKKISDKGSEGLLVKSTEIITKK
jgi:serine O-acetyltransferase